MNINLLKLSKHLLVLTSVLGLGTISISPALADNHTDGMESSSEMEGMTTDEMESTQMDGMTTDEMESTQMEGMTTDEMESTQMEGMTTDEMESTQMDGMTTDEMESTTETEMPMNESSAEAGDIVEVASGDETFSTLVQAVEAAGLADTLSDSSSSYTVFAPTNEAFNQLPAGTLDYLLQPENQEVLQQVLSYHVLPERITASEISGGSVDSLNGGLAIAVTDRGVVINNASVVTPDIEASNGVIHAVNRVLLPANLQSTLASELGIEETEIYQ